jgi:hypothetical protein
VPKPEQAILPVFSWWLEDARELVRTETRSLDDLGAALVKHIKPIWPDRKPFDHATLSNFKLGKKGATLELIIALCSEYPGLLPPVFFPRSRPESIEMQKVRDKRTPKPEPIVIGLPPPRPPLAEIVKLPKPSKPKRAPDRAQDAKHRAR